MKIFTTPPLKLLVFIAFVVFLNTNTAQVFTKVTTGAIVNEANNSYNAAWGDYDNDGDLDLFHSLFFAAPNNPSGNNLMFQNNCNGNFTRISQIPGGLVQEGVTGTQSCWVDYDNDGDQDLYVGANYLYQNQGNGSFIKLITTISSFTPNYTSASFADFDNDGLLDMYNGTQQLYKNKGNNYFEAINIAPFDSIPFGYFGDAISWVDYDNDGFMDIYLCNAFSIGSFGPRNYLFHNNGNGTFTENNLNTDLTTGVFGYGCAWGDIDNDGDLDVWINAPFAGGDRLMRNDGGGNFTRLTSNAVSLAGGIGQAGASFADYDNDGDLDLMIPNFGQNFLFANDGLGNFTQITNEIVVNDTPTESYAAAWADYDNDGDLDLFVPTAFGNPNDNLYINNVYENNIANTSWLKFKLNGTTSNKNGVGARIYAKATINGISKWQFREVNINTTRGGESGGASGQIIHMGFGDATVIDSLKIVWPASNTIQVFTNINANQQIKITEGLNTLSNLTPIADCTQDLPVKNPAIVSGKLYKDVNNNCVFDAGDEPIANKAVQASPGNYYGFSNNNGDYTIKLPAGNYSINTAFQNDIWGISTCQTISTYTINAFSNQLITGKNFSFELLGTVPCSFNYATSIQSIGITAGTCPSGQLYQTPCPKNRHKYCFTIRNNSLASSPNVSYATVTFPPFFRILGSTLTSPNGTPINLFSGNNTNVGIIRINTPLVPGQIVEICMEVEVDLGATAPFETSIDYNYTLTPASNLVLNPSFEFGYANFTSTYVNDCFLSNRGEYCVGTNPLFAPPAAIGGVNQTPRTGTKFLYATNSISSKNVWCQTVNVIPNTQYEFSAYFNNITDPTLANSFTSDDPQLRGTINGVSVFDTPLLPEIPNTWVNARNIWCSETQTSAQLCIKNTKVFVSTRGFGIDDISFAERPTKIRFITEDDACSCDPNDKNVSPKGCGPNGNISKTETLMYKIRFQNTGNGVARNVLLRDELDADLDLSTLQILVASHKITDVQILPNNALIVQFDSIMLPSVLVDEAGSNGFLVIEVAPKTGLADGTQIQNQVGIYFDENEVVLTNSVLNTLYNNPTPDASYTYKHNCTNTALAYDFVNTSTIGATYFWEFQDAVNPTSTLQNPSNIVFNSVGYKYVKLTVNLNGCIDVYADSILVENVLSTNGKKVTICHNGNNIQINLNALQSHLNHGDCIASCQTQANEANKRSIENLEPLNESMLDNEQKLQLEVDVFPNPANTELNFKISDKTSFTNLKIELYNFSGQKLLEKQITDNEKTILLKTENLPTGIYLVRIISEKETASKKIFIQH